MTTQPTPAVSPRPAQRARNVTFMVTVSVLSALVMLVFLPGYMESRLSVTLGPAAVLVNLAGLVGSLVLLPKVLYRAPSAPTWTLDEDRERRALRHALVIIALACVSDGAGLAAGIAFVSIAGRRRWPPIIATVATFGTAYVAGRWLIVSPEETTLPPGVEAIGVSLFTASLVLFGLYRGSRRDLWRSLQQEADLARREQSARMLQAREAERTRIAREMHDSLSHRLALISLHAGALEYRDDLDPATAREAAGVLRATAQTAAEELGAVLAVLRRPDDGTAPAPTLAEVRSLVEATRTPESPVDLQVAVGPGEPDTAVIGHLYRIVQESLTNAVKHAPGQRVTVTITGSPDAGVHVTASNPLPNTKVDAAGSGLGLAGLTERMALIGGRIRATPVAGSFVVEAWLPWA